MQAGRIAGHGLAMVAPAMPKTTPFSRLATNRTVALGLPLVIYLGMSFLLFGRGGHWLTSYRGMSMDPVSLIWYLHWWPFAISHGLNPFVTNYLWYPHGFNIAWATSLPVPALVMAPFTYLLGPIFSYNLLTMAAPALAGWTAFLLCEDLTDEWLAALFGGYLYGFSSYEIGHLLGHLNLDFTCLVPLILLLCIRRIRGDVSGRAFQTALTLCLVAEYGIATELLATLCVFGAVTWMVFFVFASPGERPRMFRTAIEISVAAVIAVIVISPFLYFMAKGAGDVPKQINDVQSFSTDPLNVFIPTSLTWLNTDFFIRLSQQFPGGASEQGGYLGLPLLLLLAIFFVTRRHRPYVVPLLVITCILLICSLGYHLALSSVPTHIILPWRFTRVLPLLDKVLPTRFSMYVSLSTAIASAMMLASAKGWLRWACYGLALAAIASLLPSPAMSLWTPWPAAPVLTAQTIPGNSGKLPNVLILPIAEKGPEMAWQLDAHMGFTQTGGYTGFIPLTEARNPLYADLYNGSYSTGTIDRLKALCSSHGIDYILLAPATPPAQAAAIIALGWPVRHVAGGTIITVPPAAQINR